MPNEELIPHLFRTEYRKIVSVLCKRFGFDQMEIAEDIASETFMTAAQSWGIVGIPPNPSAWLYNVAKNKAKNYLHRTHTFVEKVSAQIIKATPGCYETEIDLSLKNISDSQLQMMFAICSPIIGTEAQIGLSLRILCGFGIQEIADAFLSNKETINKRLFRAKEKLREQKVKFEIPSATEIDQRLEPVLTTIYLLFNEGYYSVSQDKTVRRELCFEAIRLCTMLVENESTNKPQVNALLSLMCFHASRFDARANDIGEPVLYQDQDTTLWNSDLISKGAYFLGQASTGNKLSQYHLEAGIAYWNTYKDDTKEKWEHTLQLYNQLLQIAYSPIAALNRTYALAKARGIQEAIVAAEKLELTDNQFYFALLGELYTDIDVSVAKHNFKMAKQTAKNEADKQAIQKRMTVLFKS